ncbi:MAG: DMT family transporter [Myxococcota bacterium]|nr:DMT family transporter [Myxococcota bacterium]
MRSSNARAMGALLVVTIIWGWTFSWMKSAIVAGELALPGQGTLVILIFLTTRFGLAAVLMPIFVPAVRRSWTNGPVWSDGGLIATVLLSGFLLQMFGLQGVDPAVSAFLTSLYVAFTAVLMRVLNQTRIGFRGLVGVTVVTTGAAFISGPPQLNFDGPEWLTVFCALVFALHIMVTDRVSRRNPPLGITWTSFVWVTAASTLMVLIAMTDEQSPTWTSLTSLYWSTDFLMPSVYASLFGTLLALSLMTNFQRALSPIRAAIVYALEPVWASLIAVYVGQTTIDGWLLFGGTALLAGNLWMEMSRDGQSSPQT